MAADEIPEPRRGGAWLYCPHPAGTMRFRTMKKYRRHYRRAHLAGLWCYPDEAASFAEPGRTLEAEAGGVHPASAEDTEPERGDCQPVPVWPDAASGPVPVVSPAEQLIQADAAGDLVLPDQLLARVTDAAREAGMPVVSLEELLAERRNEELRADVNKRLKGRHRARGNGWLAERLRREPASLLHAAEFRRPGRRSS
jgi:hypothetical protein